MVGTFVLDPDLRIQWVNQAFRAMLDEPDHSRPLENVPFVEVAHLDVDDRVISTLRGVSDTGAPVSIPQHEFEGFKQGPLHWRLEILPLKGEGAGPPYSTLVYVANVTEQVLQSRTVLAQAAYIDLLFEQSTAPLVLLDPDYNFLRVNQAYASACHRDIGDFTGQNHFVLYPSDTKALFDEVVRAKQPMTVKARAFQFPDHPEWGVTYWDWTLTPLLGNDGNVQALLFALEDVTDRRSRRPGLFAANAWRVGRALFERRRAVPTLVIGAVAEAGTMYGIDHLGSPEHYLGLPGAIAALLGVVAATVSGPAVGAVVAFCGGMAYFVFLTNFGATVESAAIVLSILLWMASAALAGLAADWVRNRAAERERMLNQTAAEREQLLGTVRQSEEAARNHAEELEKLMDLVPAAIFVSRDAECREISGNREADRMYETGEEINASAGTAGGQVLDTTRRWFSKGRELRPDEMPMQVSAATGQDINNYEMDALLPSGRRITMLGNSSPLLDDQGRVRGCLGAFLDITDRKMAEADRELLLREQRDLNTRLSTANDELRAQREKLRQSYRRQAHLARQQQRLFERLQRIFLDALPGIPNLDYAHDHLSATSGAEIGGDFYDLFLIRQDCAGLMVGDVSGQGIEASRVALMVKDAINAYALEASPPADVMRKVNDMLVKKDLRGFVTAFYGSLELDSGQLAYSSAGHPSPLVLASGIVRALDFTPAPPLGVFSDARYTEARLRLPDGAALLLYTDGVTEARKNGLFYGDDRLAESFASYGVSPISDLPAHLFQDVLDFADGTVKDDAAILAIRYCGPQGGC